MATSNRPETPEEIIANLQRNKNKPAQQGNGTPPASQPIGASAPESSQHEQLRTGNDKPKTEQSTPLAQSQPRGNGTPPPPSASPFTDSQEGGDQSRNSGRGKRIVFGIIAGAVMLGGVLAGTLVLINNGNDNGPTSTAAPIAEEQVEPAAEKPAVADEQPEPAPVVEQPEPEPAVTTEQPLVIIVNPALLNGMSSDQLGVVRLQYPNRENIDVSHGDTVTRALSNTGSTNLSVTVVNEQDGETVSQSEVADHNRMGLQIELPHTDHRIDVGLAFNPETGELELDGDYPGLRLEDGILLVNELRQGELRSHTEQALDRGIPDDRRLTFVDPDGASSAEDAVDMLLRWGYASSRDDIQCIFSEDITVDAFVARRDGATAGFRETSLNGSPGYLCSVPVMNIQNFAGVPFNDMPPAAQMVMAGIMDPKDMGTKTVGTQEECINPFEPKVSTPTTPTPGPVVTTPPAPATSTTNIPGGDTVEDEVEEDRVEEVTEEAVEETEETDEVDDSEPQMQSFKVTSEGAYSAVDCTDQGVQHAAQGIAVRGDGPYVFLTKTVQALSQEDAQAMVDAELTETLNDYHASLEQQIADGTACGTASQTLVDPAGREPEQAQPERVDFSEAEATSSVNMEHEGVVAGTQAEPTREPPAEGEETERIRNNAISDNSYDNPAPEPRVEKFDSTPPQPSGDIAAESVNFELDSDGDGERDSDIGVGATSLQRSSTSE